MPKCISHGCDQTAFYGHQFAQPRFCKTHAPAGSGSVKKKCTFGDCANAIIDSGDFCPRCSAVNASVRAMWDELHKTIGQENAKSAMTPSATPTTQVFAQLPAVPQSSAQAIAMTQRRAPKTTAAPNMFAPSAQTKPPTNPHTDSSVLSTKPKAASKIVRTPDEPTKNTSDLAIAKKRAQTPGRSRSAAETKADL